jgi:hypothetical protein
MSKCQFIQGLRGWPPPKSMGLSIIGVASKRQMPLSLLPLCTVVNTGPSLAVRIFAATGIFSPSSLNMIFHNVSCNHNASKEFGQPDVRESNASGFKQYDNILMFIYSCSKYLARRLQCIPSDGQQCDLGLFADTGYGDPCNNGSKVPFVPGPPHKLGF